MSDRIEVLTRVERRRHWSEADRLRLLSEAFAPGAVVEHVARRHGVATSCLYGWRKRHGFSPVGPGATEAGPPVLIPVSISRPEPAPDAVCGSIPALRSDTGATVTLPDGTRIEFGAGYPLRTRPPTAPVSVVQAAELI